MRDAARERTSESSDPLVRPKALAARLSRALAKYVPVRPVRMRNSRAIVSITFDDVPDSALTNGARVLDQYGAKGTFYIAPGICGRAEQHWRVISEDQIAELAARGHEVACHTMGHRSVQTLSRRALAEETLATRSALSRICRAPPSRNFAYPFGVASWPRKVQLSRDFRSCRGTYEGLNAGWLDLMHVRAIELYDRTLPMARYERLLDAAIERNAWLVLFTHDCADPPSWIGCSPELLEKVVAATLGRGVALMSVDAALNEILSERLSQADEKGSAA